MALACQHDSYLRTLQTTILSCTPCDNEDDLHVAILKDTVLFPEGGGQPDDRGTVNGIEVTEVKRNGTEVLHYLRAPLTIGQCATVQVNWKRRFDHMQQHTGQHLLTATAEKILGYNTTSWCLGENVSYIELDVPALKKEEIQNLEEVLNEQIRNCVPVTIHFYERDDPEILQVRTRLKLPEDHSGSIRVICIEGIDKNTCCGTHVKNLSELQMIKLLYAEKGKKNKTNLYFLVGNRVRKHLERSILVERSVSSLLNCNTNDIAEMVQKLQKSVKLSNKNTLLALRDLAVMEAKMFKSMTHKPSFFFLHKKNAEPEFMSIFLNEVNDKSILFFLTVGDGSHGGQLILAGPDHLVQKYGSKICDILDGKGSGKNGKFQGKFNKASNIPKVEDFLRSIMEIQ